MYRDSQTAAIEQDQEFDKEPSSADDATMAPPEEMTEEELRLMADTVPGDGPGGD